MKKPQLRALSLACIAGAASYAAFGATRTVQFAGLFGGEYQTPVGPNSDFAFCQLAIVNTGTTNQRILRVKFIGYDVIAKKTMPNTGNLVPGPVGNPTGTNADQMMLRSPAGPAVNNCINVSLPPNGMCLARFATESIPMDGRYTLCSGDIQVKDETDAQPGSVVAAGAITQFQEMFVVGGTFSGALYMSGTHLYYNNSPPANLAQSSAFPYTRDAPITNMNFYCSTACHLDTHGPMTQAQCDEACGGGDTFATGEWPYTAGIGYIQASNVWPTTSAYTPPPSTAPGFFPGGSPGNDAGFSGSAGTPSAVLHVANPHYAGGLVMEMNVGPMNQICSGNSAFWADGGEEFTHADAVDTHAIIWGSTNIPGPPERLLCSHRHAKDDIYMQLGSSTSFSINGGVAF